MGRALESFRNPAPDGPSPQFQPTDPSPLDVTADINGNHMKLNEGFIGPGNLGFVPFGTGGVYGGIGKGGQGSIVLPLTNNRIPTDADFYHPVDGLMVYDAITCTLYIRTEISPSHWTKIGLTAA